MLDDFGGTSVNATVDGKKYTGKEIIINREQVCVDGKEVTDANKFMVNESTVKPT